VTRRMRRFSSQKWSARKNRFAFGGEVGVTPPRKRHETNRSMVVATADRPGGVARRGRVCRASWDGFGTLLRIHQIPDDREDAARTGIHELRDYPIYVYRGETGYDGHYYAQIAFHPGLDAPDIARGIDNLTYRARRILGSTLAWALAGGVPARIANAYAALNLGVWLVLAGLLWRLLAVSDWRSWLAWAGLLFSAGAFAQRATGVARPCSARHCWPP